MEPFTLHRIGADNVTLLDLIAEDVFDDEIDAAQLADYVSDPRHALYVALEEGVVIGQARGVIHLQPDKPPDLYIDNLGVTPSAQRRGVASALIDALLAWARTRGCDIAWVATEPDNVQANPFYAARGFRLATVAYYEKLLE